MREIRTSGSMSGDGKRGDLNRYRARPRLYPEGRGRSSYRFTATTNSLGKRSSTRPSAIGG